jgi:hypothetical protein
MSIGVELSDEDLEAIRHLYKVRWTANIHTWKERDTDYCLWFVSCPNLTGSFITETGNSLADTIYKLLEKV